MRIPLMFLNSLGSSNAKRVGILECAHVGLAESCKSPVTRGRRRLPQLPPSDTGEICLQQPWREENVHRCVNLQVVSNYQRWEPAFFFCVWDNWHWDLFGWEIICSCKFVDPPNPPVSLGKRKVAAAHS